MKATKIYQTFRSFRFFYSCIASIIGLNVALVLSILRINWEIYPNGLPDSANARENLTFLLPVWLLVTIFTAILPILISEWGRPLEAKIDLFMLNTLNWTIFQFLAIGAYWFFLPYHIVEIAFSFPARLFLNLLKIS